MIGVPARAASPLRAYWGGDNSQHVIYIDGSGHIRELYEVAYHRWQLNDLSALAKGPPAEPTSWLHGYWGGDASQHINYTTSNGHVHELYIRPGIGWVDNDLTTAANATPARVGSPVCGYYSSDGSQHVNFVDVHLQVHELLNVAGSPNWVDNNLTRAAGGPPADVLSQLHSYYEDRDASQHVNYMDANGHIHELYIAPGREWKDTDLTSITGSAPALLEASIGGNFEDADQSQHVNYIGRDGHVFEMFFEAGGNWSSNDLSSIAGSTFVEGRSALSSYYENDDRSQHVNWIDQHGNVHELIFAWGGRWVDNNLTAETSAPAAGFSLASYYQATDRSQHVFFIDSSNHVNELYRPLGGPWQHFDLTFQAAIDPSIMITNAAGLVTISGGGCTPGSQVITSYSYKSATGTVNESGPARVADQNGAFGAYQVDLRGKSFTGFGAIVTDVASNLGAIATLP